MAPLNIAPLVIAHRGASGYLPEHTLPAKALAYAMGAHFLEQDVVASADDELVVLHDIYLDRVTNVAECFPDRGRADGRFYVRDFNLTELRTLKVWERMDAAGSAVYPGRYPARSGEFRIHTLGEEIDFIQKLNIATSGTTGIYPEIKRPAWHSDEGVDITARMLRQLEDFGYQDRTDPVFVQCFDAAELIRIRHDLGCPLRLVQLIGENSWSESDTDYDILRKTGNLRDLARTVDAIGPWLNHLYDLDNADGRAVSTGLVRDAHQAGLAVHPYTFRADDLPAGFETFDDLVSYFAFEQRIDALFTDFPNKVRKILLDRIE